MTNKVKIKSPIRANKTIRQSGNGNKRTSIAVNRRTNVRIKKS